MKGVYLLVLFLASCAAYVKYDGYEVWRLKNLSGNKGEVVRALVNDLNLDVWGHGRDWLDIRVPPHLQRSLELELQAHGTNPFLLINDLQSLIEKEQVPLPKDGSTKISHTQYNDLDTIYAFMQDTATNFAFASIESVGQTYEGREMYVNILSTGAGRPIIWIDCGIHAREWITPATCVYGIDYLTSNYGTDATVTSLLDTYDIYIMPSHNPDGYVYTWSDDRMWRKNRHHYDGETCTGVDLNRNFDDGHFDGSGSSNVPCSDTYHGPSGFSEPETANVRAYVMGLSNVVSYYTIHSYSQMWMYAWGWSTTPTPDETELNRVGLAGASALTAVHDTPYAVGSIYDVIYAASGTSVDWAYSIGITYTYTLELRDTGTYGFLLPAEEIIPTAEETWAGLIAAFNAMPY